MFPSTIAVHVANKGKQQVFGTGACITHEIAMVAINKRMSSEDRTPA